MSGKLLVRTFDGIVISFNKTTLEGIVLLTDERRLSFNSMCFHSPPPFRFGKCGDKVRVTISTETGNVVIVRTVGAE